MLLLLLLLGTSVAYPQYGPVIHEDPAPEPEPQDIFPTQQIQDGGGLTQDFEEKPKFWWLNSGIFSGTDKEPSSHSEPGEGVGGPFTPHQSKFCDTGFDCVPYGLCHEGLITPLGEGVLQQRSKPANFDDLQCGQAGNICCGIPEDILTAQRENVEGIEVIEDVYVQKTPDVGEISQAPVIEVVKIPIEEVPDYIFEEKPYIEEDPDTKQESPPSSPLEPDTLPIVPDVDGTYDPSPVAVSEGEEVVESDPSATRIEGQDSLGHAEVDFCGHVSYKCVPYFLCKDGVIVTDGAGLIDVRIRPQGVCTHPEYPDVPGVCCLKPGTDPTPSPLEQCPDYQECVEYNLCTSSGTIDTEGGGGLNLRTGRQNCYLPSGANGVCCSPPPPIPEVVQFCPENSECMLENQCTGQALDGSKVFVDYHSSGSWASCTLENIYGICCIRSIPVIRETCPENSACVLKDQCSGQALDESSNFVDYIQSGTWSYCSSEYGQGVCCRSLPPKVIIDTCPGESVCLKPDLCKGDALDASDKFVEYSSPGEWSHCSQHVGGVCCINPVTNSYLQPASSCGVRNYKIDERITSTPYGGNEASFGEFPWQAIIFFQNYTYVCGASLVSNKHLVTAAHCVDGYQAGDIKIRFGEWQVVSTDEALPYVDINVHKIYIHSQFNSKNVHKDIAVLELSEPVDYQYHINSVCLPPQGAVIEPYTKCFTTGWGKDSFEGTFQHILKKIELPYLDHQTCQDLLRKTRLGKYFRLDSSFVCAGGEENKDACFGDGGGPLVYKDKVTSQYTLVGITSWGIGCGTKDVPGVYVNVPAFADWINEIILGQYQEPKEQVSEDHLKDVHLQQPGEEEPLGQPQLHHEPGHVDPVEQPDQPQSQDPEPDVSQPSESKPVDHQPYEEQPHPPKPEDVPPIEVPHDSHPEIIPAVEVPHDPQPQDHHSQPNPDDQQTHDEQQQQQEIPEEELLPIPGYGK